MKKLTEAVSRDYVDLEDGHTTSSTLSRFTFDDNLSSNRCFIKSLIGSDFMGGERTYGGPKGMRVQKPHSSVTASSRFALNALDTLKARHTGRYTCVVKEVNVCRPTLDPST